MPRIGTAIRIGYCIGCRRERRIDDCERQLCSSCSESRRRHGGKRPCSYCKQGTYQNFTNPPKVMCLDCFHGQLRLIRAFYLEPFQEIERHVNLSRPTIRGYCQYFYGTHPLPRASYAAETLKLLAQLKSLTKNTALVG